MTYLKFTNNIKAVQVPRFLIIYLLFLERTSVGSSEYLFRLTISRKAKTSAMTKAIERPKMSLGNIVRSGTSRNLGRKYQLT